MKTITLFLCLFTFTISCFAQPVQSLKKGFKDPPASARPKALWPWVNGNTNLSQITYELEEAKRKGMGGFDIWDIGASVDPNKLIPAGPAFLSDQSQQAIAHTINEADRLGLEIGLTFSSSWNAGGSWVKPEHAAMGLFRTDTIITGPQTLSSTLSFPIIPETYQGRPNLSALYKNSATGLPVFYKEVGVIAHPYQEDSVITSLQQIIDLKDQGSAGKIKWEVPPGVWRITRYVCAPTGQPLAIPSTNSNGLMLDHFSAAAQRANLTYIFDKLLSVTGPLKNRSLKYLYGD
ncbi:MAG: glycosyl hydrolase, partial [Chitinophagaceae bacterium]